MLLRAGQQVFLEVEGERIALGAADLPLASAVASSYHNQICYNAPPPDSWNEETAIMEANARAHMEEPTSPDDSDTVHS